VEKILIAVGRHIPASLPLASALLAVAFCLLLPISPSSAQVKDETLLVHMPDGFKVGYQSSHDGMTMQEWVPEKETVENWSEMVTVQVFLGRKTLDTAPFLNRIGQQWLATCAGSTPDTIHTGQANGYIVSMLLLHCPLNPQSGKPETTLFRAIKGNDSFYVVQRAARYEPSKDQISTMAHYLSAVNVCDARTREHPCPDLKPPGSR
jgi:hypothetical protein